MKLQWQVNSHSYHLKYLEEKISTPITKGLDCLGEFIEICERRNLYVHSNGEVSQLYLDNCRDAHIEIPGDLTIGKKLPIKAKYFTRAMEVFFEIGVKLGHVMWRKLVPEEIENADDSLSDICYNLILRKQYETARDILKFAVTMPNLTDVYKKIMTINLANCYKLLKDAASAKKLLGQTDWSAAGLRFRISVAAILDQHVEASDLMKRIGDNGEVKKIEYHTWPVFISFRETPEFKKTYRDLFGVEYQQDEIEIKKRLGLREQGKLH